jgi:hypothetical protein
MTPSQLQEPPRVLASVDPGKHDSWLAIYLSGVLAAARRCPGQGGAPALVLQLALEELGAAGLPGVLVVERPVVYPGGRTKRPADQLAVAVVAGGWQAAGEIAGLVSRGVEPAVWKGQLDKLKVERRLREALDLEEIAVLDAAQASVKKKNERHNVADCVAIGAWVLGRVPLATWDRRYADTRQGA